MKSHVSVSAITLLVLTAGCSGDAGFEGESFRKPTGTLTIDGLVLPIHDLHFWGDDLELGGHEMELREIIVTSPGEQVQLYGKWEGHLGKHESVDVTALRSQAIQLRVMDVEGDAFSSIATSGGKRLVVGGTLTLTKVSNERKSQKRSDSSVRVVQSWDVVATVELEIAMDAGLLEGFHVDELDGVDKQTMSGTLRGVAYCEYWTQEGN